MAIAWLSSSSLGALLQCFTQLLAFSAMLAIFQILSK